MLESHGQWKVYFGKVLYIPKKSTHSTVVDLMLLLDQLGELSFLGTLSFSYLRSRESEGASERAHEWALHPLARSPHACKGWGEAQPSNSVQVSHVGGEPNCLSYRCCLPGSAGGSWRQGWSGDKLRQPSVGCRLLLHSARNPLRRFQVLHNPDIALLAFPLRKVSPFLLLSPMAIIISAMVKSVILV